jgi:hypothetical protein
VARPTKYQPEYARQASVACKLGATDQDLADLFEVSRSTLNLWKIEHTEFSDALKQDKSVADSRVERSLFQRAVGYSHEEDDIRVVEGQIVVTPTIKHYPPDTTACIFWLKNRMSEQYRANPEDSGSGSDKLVDAISNLIDKLPN